MAWDVCVCHGMGCVCLSWHGMSISWHGLCVCPDTHHGMCVCLVLLFLTTSSLFLQAFVDFFSRGLQEEYRRQGIIIQVCVLLID